ncbi:Dimethyl sulfoxide reductase DmsA precursor [Slackia heliotrinireducens]|uniref:Anaerobic dehydrogenase, typically selenocysteine-containing n=1 Tax=Slackia heliotrinireducens (strain ATCC 29202 / DSM 20476 / NCTC 11029 / RHS 1) TaxID=471855 RepID=C7N4L5_SLAHD|nr:molybdopterin-dependent oxidoreductase [Slackia heliotrinireducens]ACV21850.1 anaerobic dehydrogenase, typically selenocysteine-containing [Slackia heliotrinireducens DSM 20476]VEG99597.1 Dimethyl sulfoxide reductase DmsA precursor [Slackia heliotrinireducens]
MKESLTRRTFVKGAGVSAAGAAIAGVLASCSQNTGEEAEEMENLEASHEIAEKPEVEEQEYFCTCSWSCSFCQYRVFVRDGNISHMLPREDFDYRTCLKGRARIQRTYSEARVQYPMKRKTYSVDDPHPENRGNDEWEQITWDEAGDMIAQKWAQVEADFGPLANTYYQGCGSQGSLNGNAGLIMRLFNATGCTAWHYSFDAATNAGLTRGGIQWFDQSEPQDFVNSDYILIMGANPVGAQVQMWKFIAAAQEAGAKLICVDPVFSPTVAKSDKWITVKPGTDPALYLGLIKKFIDDETYVADFVLNHTCAPFLIKKEDGMYLRGGEYQDEPLHVGPPFWVTGLPTEIDPIMVWDEKEGKPACFDECENPAWTCPDDKYITAWDMFKEHIQEWTLDKVMEVTGISEDDFNFLYDVLQPEHKVTHYINFGTGAYENGLHAAYALCALIAMTANFGEPGRSVGGFDAMYGNFFGHALTAPSNGKSFTYITWLDACNIMSSGELNGEPYPIKTMIQTHGGLIGGSVNSDRTKHEFLDKLEQYVVVDPFMTDSARYADIVLPACDTYEYEDVVPLSHEHNVRISEKAIEPLYEAKVDSEIARFLAEKMGLADAVCDVTDDDWWKGTFDDVQAAVDNGITMDTLRENKIMRYVSEFPYIGNKDYKNFITETGRIMFYTEAPAPRTPSTMDVQSIFDREKMPTYFENKIAGENSEYAAEFPLVMISHRNPSRVHMTHFMKDWARDVMPDPILFVHPNDAKKFGVEDGQDILITSTVGQCVMKCVYHTGMREGMTVYNKGYAENETKFGSQGAITTDYCDPYAVNCSFFDNRIKIEPWTEQ